jgi:outer membrane protein TolC
VRCLSADHPGRGLHALPERRPPAIEIVGVGRENLEDIELEQLKRTPLRRPPEMPHQGTRRNLQETPHLDEWLDLREIPNHVLVTLRVRNQRPDSEVQQPLDELIRTGSNLGVAVGAYFPQITLSGLGGYAGNPLSKLFNIGNRIWSVGASASDTLYDFGDRAGAVYAARATYDQYVATYRQTVLTGFQQVEDELLALRVLRREEEWQAKAVASAKLAADVALNEFNAGTVAYTTVVTAQQTLLSEQQSELTIRQNQLADSVTLIEALGGGWDYSQL